MTSFKTMAVAAALISAPLAAQAEIFNFTFSGVVESTNLADNTDVDAIGELNAGDEVSGSFTFDGSVFSGAGAGTFASAADAVSNFLITVDGFSYSALGLGSAFLYDNHMPGSAADVTDGFFAGSGQLTGADQGGFAVTSAQFSIGTIVELGILNDLSSPNLSQFEQLIAANTFDGNTNILGFGTGEDVRFNLAEVTVEMSDVPLPAGGLLLLAGLGGLGALRRRQSR